MDGVHAPQFRGNRLAGAPVSWGACEVPNRGCQLAPSRVLAEMSEVGLAATRAGHVGVLLTRAALAP